MSAPGPLVMVVEDEPQMRRFLRASLVSHGYDLCEATSAAEAVALATSRGPELILLDLGLPDEDGIAVTRRLREWSRVPIIIISARGREADKVGVLDAGADDYLTKPFGVGELLARMRVALRHAQQTGGAPEPIIQIGPLRIDLARREVKLNDAEVHLTPIEYRLLTLLAQNAGRVLTHGQILKEVWGPGHAGETHYLRVYMAQLRRKIEVEPARPRLLQTEPGVGYRLREATS
ncbi:MAG TPA: response regulator [Polyangia bacterium]|nr:response regulator [Polyangia bacterium]